MKVNELVLKEFKGFWDLTVKADKAAAAKAADKAAADKAAADKAVAADKAAADKAAADKAAFSLCHEFLPVPVTQKQQTQMQLGVSR